MAAFSKYQSPDNSKNCESSNNLPILPCSNFAKNELLLAGIFQSFNPPANNPKRILINNNNIVNKIKNGI